MVGLLWNKTDNLEIPRDSLIDLQTMVHERMDVVFYPKQLVHITSDHDSKVVVNHMGSKCFFKKGSVLFKIIVDGQEVCYVAPFDCLTIRPLDSETFCKGEHVVDLHSTAFIGQCNVPSDANCTLIVKQKVFNGYVKRYRDQDTMIIEIDNTSGDVLAGDRVCVLSGHFSKSMYATSMTDSRLNMKNGMFDEKRIQDIERIGSTVYFHTV